MFTYSLICGTMYPMNIDEFIKHLQSKIAEHGTQREYAAALGVSAAYLSDVLNKRRDPGRRFLDAVGFERVILYQAKGDEVG